MDPFIEIPREEMDSTLHILYILAASSTYSSPFHRNQPMRHDWSMGRYFFKRAELRLREPFNFVKRRILRASGVLKDCAYNDNWTQMNAAATGGEWERALTLALKASSIAESTRNPVWMFSAGGALVRLGMCDQGLRLMADAGRIWDQPTLPEWSGEDISNCTLLIDGRGGHVGALLRCARFIWPASERARRTIVLVEPRMVPLFRRTFAVDVRPAERKSEAVSESDVVAGFDTLAAIYANDWSAIQRSFIPLRADPGVTLAFRNRYQSKAGTLPLIGISWGSISWRKQMPGFTDWSAFLRKTPSMFISLQYGEISAALRRLRRGAGERLVQDTSVDQMTDMDGFTAQIASLDAVISISNTTVHTAGALGIPTVMVLDDRFDLLWPATGGSSGWYPSVQIVRKHGRGWSTVLKDAQAQLEILLAGCQSPG